MDYKDKPRPTNMRDHLIRTEPLFDYRPYLTQDSLPRVMGNMVPQPDSSETALHVATTTGDLETLKEILTTCIDQEEFRRRIDGKNKDGNTPLQCAIISGKEECVKYLISEGADVTSRNQFGQNALDVAVTQGEAKIVELVANEMKRRKF